MSDLDEVVEAIKDEAVARRLRAAPHAPKVAERLFLARRAGGLVARRVPPSVPQSAPRSEDS